MAELSEALLSVLPSIRVPKAGDRVHKDECAFSFDTPVSAPHRRPARPPGLLPPRPAPTPPPAGAPPARSLTGFVVPRCRGGRSPGCTQGPRGLLRPACPAARPTRPRCAGGCSSGAGAGVGRALARSVAARLAGSPWRGSAPGPNSPCGGSPELLVRRGAGGRARPGSALGGEGCGPGVPPCPGLSHHPSLAARRGPAGGGRVGAVSLRWQWSLLQPSPPRWHPCASCATPARPKWTWGGEGSGRARSPLSFLAGARPD